MKKNKQYVTGYKTLKLNDIINDKNYKIFYNLFKQIHDNGSNSLDCMVKALEDKTPYHGKILCAYPDNTSNTWRIDFRKHKIKFFPKYRSSYVNRFLTRQEAVEYIKKAEE